MKYLTDKQLKSYREYYPDECSEFVHAWTKFHTWLPVDIALDDDQSYKLRKHSLWIYFNNNYQVGDPVWVPLAISEDECYIPIKDIKLNITSDDFSLVKIFCQNFYHFIKQLANAEIDFSYFVGVVDNMIFALNESEVLMGSTGILCEMATFNKELSGLPRNLYIDDDNTYMRGGHGPRVKFQSPKTLKNKRLWPSITFGLDTNSDTPLEDLEVIKHDSHSKIDLTSKEIDHIKYFVRENASLLIKIANHEINFHQFKEMFNKVDQNGNIIPRNHHDYFVYGSSFGLTIVRNNEWKFNVLRNGVLISDQWYDAIYKFKSINGELKAQAELNGQFGVLYPDGTFKTF